MAPKNPSVFISYSHDTPAHSKRVLALAYALRDDGIDVELDQFHSHEIVNWPQWCREQIGPACSDFVLCVCTEEFNRRIEGNVPPEQGKGVYWEGALLENEIYDDKGNRRIIPVLFDDEPEAAIPRILRGWTRCRFRDFTTDDPGYEQVIRILTRQACVEKNPLGTIPDLPPKTPLPATLSGQPAVGTAPRLPQSSSLTLWQEKLDFLLAEEAKAADPAQKFQLHKLIEEARERIREHGPQSAAGGEENHRRIDAVTPSYARLGETIDLLVQVRMPDSEFLSIEDWPFREKPDSLERASASAALQFPVDQRTGRLASAKLLIRVVAPDFGIEGAAEKTLEVPPDRDSTLLSFLLKTQKRGACRINVEAYTLANEYVGTIPVATIVNGDADQQVATLASMVVVVLVTGEGTTHKPRLSTRYKTPRRTRRAKGSVKRPSSATHFVDKSAHPRTTQQKRFKIALSFPGEHRTFVEQVAAYLAKHVGPEKILYDAYYEAEFARPDLDTYLQHLYHDESELIVVFLCADYDRKEWCGLEWRAIRDLIKKRQVSTVMPVRFDDTEIPGLFSTDGYVWAPDHTPEEIAELILQRMQINAGSSTPALIPPPTDTNLVIAPTRLHHGAIQLLGRDNELADLDQAWTNPATHLLTIVAFGGVGKTSLIIEWMARKSAAGWPGFQRVFDWSFYSQGTRDQTTASADTFIAKALEFFGDPTMAKSAASPQDKGARLAHLIAQYRTLLVIDGLEPLQYPPGPMTGQLKDPAIETLLRGLAQQNPGLCLVTTREKVTDLAPFCQTTAPQWNLEFLSQEAGAAVLHQAGANRAGAVEIDPNDQELKDASQEVEGHALTLNLLGSYLALAQGGDIRKRDTVKLADADPQFKTNPADADKPYGHAFKVMGAYEKWLATGGDEGARQLAVLRLLGLFDRPADNVCLAALRETPAIDALTEPLMGLSDQQWNITLKRLADSNLITVQPNQNAIDAHPLIREYFADQLQGDHPEAWRAAHARLYQHLKDSTKDKPEPNFEDLHPLYQAVAHGCQAGLHQDACDDVYYRRIQRGNEAYSSKKLGAIGANLGAIACFFEHPWSRISPELSEPDQAWMLNEAAFHLRALGRLTEALDPMRVSMDMDVERKAWQGAAMSASNLSELELILGTVPAAVHDAQQSVTFADLSADAFSQTAMRTTLADALHQAGQNTDAQLHFAEAETIQAEHELQYPLLYSVQGFQYCDLLLADPERAAWVCCLKPQSPIHELHAAIGEVEHRATQTLAWAESASESLHSLALDHLTLGRAAIYRCVLTDSKKDQAEASQKASQELNAAVDSVRRSGQQQLIPCGLLSRAWLRFVEGDAIGAQNDLNEAWRIAERGPMPLYMADIHLYRARLFHAQDPYPWDTPHQDLADAGNLIDKHGYHRRDQELADAEKAAKSW